MGTLVMHYGLGEPTRETADAIREEMRRAHTFRNRLIEIERERRDALRALENSHGNVAALRDAARQARAATKSASKAAKTSKSAELKEGLTQAKATEKAAKIVLHEVLVASRTDAARSAKEAITARFEAAQKAASAETATAWGTKALHVDGIKRCQSFKRTFPDKPAPGELWWEDEPHNPHFRSWDGSGGLRVQIQKGITPDELLTDTHLRVLPTRTSGKDRGDCSACARRNESGGMVCPPKSERVNGCQCNCPRAGKASQEYRTLMMRIGSNPDRTTVWGVWPMVLHRDLPSGCRVMGATVHAKHIGPRVVWSASIIVETLPAEAHMRERGAVAINIGWRKIGDEIRVCTWYDENGKHGELRLTANDVAQIAKAEEIKSLRDNTFNAVRATLRGWLDSHDAPEWLREATKHIHAWRSPGKIVRLRRDWEGKRSDGDSEIFEVVSEWIRHDRHLWLWESNQRHQGIDRRNWIYRNFAARLAADYTVLCCQEKFVAEVSATGDAENDKRRNKEADHRRHLVAPSTLQLMIEQAFAKLNPGEVRKIENAGLTQTCAESGKPESFDAAPRIEHACECGCGMVWDQDVNAARNTMRECERPGDDENTVGARDVDITRYPQQKSESMWARLKRLKAEKASQNGTAREQGAEAAE